MLGSLILANEAGGGLGLHEWCLIWSTAFVLLIVVGSAMVARLQTGLVPKGMGACFEHMFDWLEGISVGFMGPEGRTYVPLAMSFFLFILISNWVGLVPWPSFEAHGEEVAFFESPTASVSTTLALAILSFLAFNLLGIKKRVFPPRPPHGQAAEHGQEQAHDHGHHDHLAPGGLMGMWTWIAHFWHPTPKLWKEFQGGLKIIVFPLFFLFLSLNFIEEWARIMSLSLRLYGNIYGEHVAKANMVHTMDTMFHQGDVIGLTVFVLVFGACAFVTILGALAGFVQAMVFAMLSLSYIAHAVADEH